MKSGLSFNNPTVLVVDDEELMRQVVAIMVEENGGSVIEAVNGKDAIEKFSNLKDKIDCIFMDFSMPELNGFETYCEIKKLKADIPVIMMSGLAIIPEVQDLIQAGKIGFLSKPFHENELIDTLNNCLS